MHKYLFNGYFWAPCYVFIIWLNTVSSRQWLKDTHKTLRNKQFIKSQSKNFFSTVSAVRKASLDLRKIRVIKGIPHVSTVDFEFRLSDTRTTALESQLCGPEKHFEYLQASASLSMYWISHFELIDCCEELRVREILCIVSSKYWVPKRKCDDKDVVY